MLAKQIGLIVLNLITHEYEQLSRELHLVEVNVFQIIAFVLQGESEIVGI